MNTTNILEYIKQQFKTGGMIKKIILINAVVFIVLILVRVFAALFLAGNLFDSILSYIALPGTFAELAYKPWTLLTSIFAHYELWHFFFNMLILYFTSKMFIQFFGEKRLLTTYIFGGVGGGLIHIIAYLVFPLLGSKDPGSVAGASGAVAALIGALVYYKPQLKVKLFFALEIPFWLFGAIFILGDIMSLSSDDRIAHFAHLGGVLFGVISVINVHSKGNIMNRIEKILAFDLSFKKKTKFKVYKNTEASKMSDEQYNANKANKQKKADAILEKISKNGYESLSKAEKDFLFRFGNE
jgi:membrane associated rhomboid family serine protease